MTDCDQKWDAIVLNERDQLATALRALREGENIKIRSGEKILNLIMEENIRICHKFATAHISKGEEIRKCGENIGAASENIEAGHHIHIHNLKSLRGKSPAKG